MNTFWIAIIVLAVLALVAKFALAAAGTAAAAKDKINQGASVIDVRTQAEFKAGHYSGATNIPLNELQNRIGDVGDKKKAIVVYCASGMRSARAVTILTAEGFIDVTNSGSLKNLGQ